MPVSIRESVKLGHYLRKKGKASQTQRVKNALPNSPAPELFNPHNISQLKGHKMAHAC